MIGYENVDTVRALVKKAASVYGDDPFLRTWRDGNFQNVSFRDFDTRCDAISAWVAKMTYEAGHRLRIATISPNSVEYATVILGIMYSGAAVIPMDVQKKKKSLQNCLNKARADYLILDSSVDIDVEELKRSCPMLRDVISMEAMDELRQSGEEALPEVTSSDCAAILFTSGTTGVEKGVMLSNGNITDNATNTLHDERYVKVSSLPMHHCFGLCCDLVMSLVNGSVVCIHGGAEKLAENIQRFHPTLIHAVPLVIQSLYSRLKLMAKETGETTAVLKGSVFGDRLKYIVSGGAPLPGDLCADIQALDISIAQAYGMSECSPLVSYPDLCNYRHDRSHTVGKLVLRCEARVVDQELQVKSPSVMMGYVDEPELTALAFTDDGWLHTGDMAVIDEEQYLEITGRIKNLIILSNGENVSPEGLEKTLMEYAEVQECLVYGEGNTIAAEIYPGEDWLKEDQAALLKTLGCIVQEVNEELPSYKKILKYVVRTAPLEKTGTNKIARNQRATADMILQVGAADYMEPETELQKKLFECVAAVLNRRDFGIDTDLFAIGMDSLGCITLLGSLSDQLDVQVNLDELMGAGTVAKLEQLLLSKQNALEVDYSPRAEYPLSDIQKYLVCSVGDNTTANVPALFQLDSGMDVQRLKAAIRQLFRVHPILNNRLVMADRGYVNSRDDQRPVHIPELTVSQKEWKEMRAHLVKPFTYGPEEPMYHIALYHVEGELYFLLDISHVISDGVSLNVLLENLNKLYAGESVEPERYTFYEYLVDEVCRDRTERNEQAVRYFTDLMDGIRIDRSILTRGDGENPGLECRNVEWGFLTEVDPASVQAFCRNCGVSENVVLLTAFNYCISMYSGKVDTVSTSIHSGRTDNRWSNICGCLFTTYNFRCSFAPEQSVLQRLKENALQIVASMRQGRSCMQADEMFFLFQGDLLNFDEIGGLPARKLPIQLDSLPFNLLVYSGKDGYRYELRYWENRFHKGLLQQFLKTYDRVLEAMMQAQTFADVYTALPAELFPTEHEVLDIWGRKQPVGAWGDLQEDGKSTGKTARIMPDGSVEMLEQSGRTVMQEGITKRVFLDLQKLEKILEEYPGVQEAKAYLYISSRNVPMLAADVVADESVSQLQLMKHLKERKVKDLRPSKITVIK